MRLRGVDGFNHCTSQTLPKVTNANEPQILFTVDLHVPKDQMVCLRINKAYDFVE